MVLLHEAVCNCGDGFVSRHRAPVMRQRCDPGRSTPVSRRSRTSFVLPRSVWGRGGIGAQIWAWAFFVSCFARRRHSKTRPHGYHVRQTTEHQ
jgi:hypothetical protein